MNLPTMTLTDWQQRIREQFGEKDARRGVPGNFMWLMEEVGELSAALRSNNLDEATLEFADVLAWLMSLANTAGVDLDRAMALKYGLGCPRCHKTPCLCAVSDKP
ncbi:MAG: MazG nucleotide pyrophosphohydrolase domain-containing protein [Fimbriiglobus sp.]